MYEAHTFETNNGDHSLTIHANVTHLVLVGVDVDGAEFPYLTICAFSASDAAEIVARHHRGEIWERLPNRSFSPPLEVAA